MDEKVKNTLGKNSLMQNIDLSAIDFDNINGKLVPANEGGIIYKSGDKAEFLYLLISGKVRLLKKDDAGNNARRDIKENEFFGYDEIQEKIPRVETAIAIKNSYLFLLDIDELNNLALQDESIIVNLLRSVVVEESNREQYTDLLSGEEPDSSTGIIDKEEESFSVDDLPEWDMPEMEDDEEIKFEVDDPEIDLGPDDQPDEKITLPDIDIVSLQREEADLPGEPDEEEDLEVEIPDFSFALDDLPDLDEAEDEQEPGDTDETGTPEQDETPVIPEIEDDNIYIDDMDAGRTSEEEEKLNESLIEPEETDDFEDEEIPETIPAESAVTEPELSREQYREISDIILTLRLNDGLDSAVTSVLEAAEKITDSEKGFLFLLNEEKGKLELSAPDGSGKVVELRKGEGIAGWVAQTGEIMNISGKEGKISVRPDYENGSVNNESSLLCFPLRSKDGKIIAVLQLLNNKNGKYGKKDVEMLKAFSPHAARAVAGARIDEQQTIDTRYVSLKGMADYLVSDVKKSLLLGKRYLEHAGQDDKKEGSNVHNMALEKVNELIDDLRTISFFSSSSSQMFLINRNINSLLEEYYKKIKSYLFANNASLEFEFDLDAVVRIDYHEFSKVFREIVKNSVEATPKDCKIVISTSRREKEIRIKFLDNGPGIKRDLLGKVFEPFFSSGKEAHAGIGLTLAKKTTEMMSGSITPALPYKGGFEVTLSLPLVKNP